MQTLWRQLGKVSAATLSVFGILLMPAQIYRLTQSIYMTIFASATLYVILGISAFLYFFPGAGHWRAGYGRFSTRSIVTKRISKIVIDNKFIATIHRSAEFIFFESPERDDLVDMIDTLPGEEIKERYYQSPDSTIADIRHTKPNNLVVYWKPKETIKPLLPYTHKSVHISPVYMEMTIFIIQYTLTGRPVWQKQFLQQNTPLRKH